MRSVGPTTPNTKIEVLSYLTLTNSWKFFDPRPGSFSTLSRVEGSSRKLSPEVFFLILLQTYRGKKTSNFLNFHSNFQFQLGSTILFWIFSDVRPDRRKAPRFASWRILEPDPPVPSLSTGPDPRTGSTGSFALSGCQDPVDPVGSGFAYHTAQAELEEK